MGYNEADTRSKLINPAIYARGWSEDHIKREESAGTIEIVAGKAKGRWTTPCGSRWQAQLSP